MHAFHPNCIKNMVEGSISQAKLPILCPVCNIEILEREIKKLTSTRVFDEFLIIQYKKSLAGEDNKFSLCPTPNCDTLIEKYHQSNSLKFNCPK